MRLIKNNGKQITFDVVTCLFIPGEGALPIMAYTWRLRPKGVPFSGFRYIKGLGFHELKYMKG